MPQIRWDIEQQRAKRSDEHDGQEKIAKRELSRASHWRIGHGVFWWL
jgi:hypothetical protein